MRGALQRVVPAARSSSSSSSSPLIPCNPPSPHRRPNPSSSAPVARFSLPYRARSTTREIDHKCFCRDAGECDVTRLPGKVAGSPSRRPLSPPPPPLPSPHPAVSFGGERQERRRDREDRGLDLGAQRDTRGALRSSLFFSFFFFFDRAPPGVPLDFASSCNLPRARDTSRPLRRLDIFSLARQEREKGLLHSTREDHYLDW